MDYPQFGEVYRSVTTSPRKGVINIFPSSFKRQFLQDQDYSRKILEQKGDPVLDGVIIGKARGRYLGKRSLVGLTLIELEKERFISPFYASSISKKGFIDKDIAALTEIDSFLQLDLENTIAKIRDSENLNFGNISGLGGSFFGTYIGYLLFGNILGFGNFVDELTGMSSSNQALLLSLGTALIQNHKSYRKKLEKNYKELGERIFSNQ